MKMIESSGSVILALFLTHLKQTAMDLPILKRGTEADVGVASVCLARIRVRHVVDQQDQAPSATELQISPDFPIRNSGSMKSGEVMDDGSEAKMVSLCRWWQSYVSLTLN